MTYSLYGLANPHNATIALFSTLNNQFTGFLMRLVRGQLATQADWGWPGPTVVGLASTVGLAVAGQLWTLTSTDGLAKLPH